MIVRDAIFASRTDLWETPQDFFDKLDEEFHFNLDACALPENTKCKRFWTPEDDALTKPWNGNVWCNPPYGRNIGKWIEKAYHEIREGGAKVIVLLIAARTDTRWFHEYLYNKPNVELRFIRGRLKFGGSPHSAPFPSLVAIMRKN